MKEAEPTPRTIEELERLWQAAKATERRLQGDVSEGRNER